jgi:hypothetical protein
MIIMNMFFKFMSMILKNYMFKIYLSRFLKNASKIFNFKKVVQINKIGFK